MKIGYFIVIAILIIIFIIFAVRKSHLSIKESFFWIIGSFLVLILAAFPTVINKLAELFGVAYPPALFFVFCILFLLYMIFRNSKRIAFQQEKITALTEEVAILKSKNNRNK